MTHDSKLTINRVQTGVRLEAKLLKVLKGVAEYQNRTLGELLELVILHSFENRNAFSKEGLEAIKALKKVYSMDYDVHDYKKFVENESKK
jgi:predicted DNA-binding ribbon-helix-helix protein